VRRFLFCLGGSLGSGVAVALLLAALVQHFFSEPPDRPTVAPRAAEARHVIASAKAFVPVMPSTETLHRAAATETRDAEPEGAPAVAMAVATEPAVAPPADETLKPTTPPMPAATAEPDSPAPAQAIASSADAKPDRAGSAPETPQAGAQLAALSAVIATPPATRQPRSEAAAAAARISIHYRSNSAPARAGAQQLAASLVSSGFDGPQLRTTAHKVRAPVVRYFFENDAPAAKLVAQRLQTKQGSWQTEDCTNYRKKPPAGTIEVWPTDAR
jgi:hypothetical protein